MSPAFAPFLQSGKLHRKGTDFSPFLIDQNEDLESIQKSRLFAERDYFLGEIRNGAREGINLQNKGGSEGGSCDVDPRQQESWCQWLGRCSNVLSILTADKSKEDAPFLLVKSRHLQKHSAS